MRQETFTDNVGVGTFILHRYMYLPVSQFSLRFNLISVTLYLQNKHYQIFPHIGTFCIFIT